MKLENQVNI